MKATELFRKYPKTPVFDHSNYRLFERIPVVLGTSNNRGLTVISTVILLPSTESFKKDHKVLVNFLFKLAQEKVWLG